MLGFAGYIVAALLLGAVGVLHGISLAERLVIQLVPPLSLILVVTITRRRRGKERIVFYQVTSTAVLSSIACALVGGLSVGRVADHVVTGISVFLVFGRLGCFRVACCYGQHARWGVRYDERHVAQGLAARFAGRTLLPVQLFESAASAALAVICTLQLGDVPGTATSTFTLGYAAVRFGLELFRGDAARPLLLGLSEAQWFAVGSAVVVAAITPSLVAVVASGGLVVAAVAVSIRRHRPLARVHSPQHVGEIDHAVVGLIHCAPGEAWSKRKEVAA
ncbi:MAG: prolipoprotein diacylglyceryl transferase family protein [Kofleriaceae bacterium]